MINGYFQRKLGVSMRKCDNQYSSRITTYVCSFLAAVALCINFKQPTLNSVYTENAISEIFWNLQLSLSNTAMQSTMLFFCFVFIGTWIENNIGDRWFVIPLTSFAIALIWLMGKGYSIDNSLRNLHASTGQIVKSFVYLIGITWLLSRFAYLVFWLLHRNYVITQCDETRWKQWVSKHIFLSVMVGLIVCWLPHVIVSYPGYSCPDSWNQVLQYFGINPFTSHHPPAHTVVMGFIIELGIKFGNYELGMFLFVLLQVLCFSVVVAYGISSMSKWQAPDWLLLGGFCFFAFSPYCSAYVNVLLKDNLYSYAFILLMTELIWLLVLKKEFFKSKKHIVLALSSIFLVSILRNNGKYVVYGLILFAIFFLFYNMLNYARKKDNRHFALSILLVLIVPVICSGVFSNYLVERFEISPGSRREMFSVLFQQTARYVSVYGDEVSDKEKAAINAVLDYDTLAENYNPRISDPVKKTFKDDATMDDLVEYIRVWLKQFVKHPMVYIHATMNQNYYLLYPKIENDTLMAQTYYDYFTESIIQIRGFENASPSEASNAQIINTGYESLKFSFPVIGAMSSPAVYNILLVFIFLFALRKKNYSCIITSLPLILSDIVILLAPVIQGHPRYAFPIIYSMPLFIACYICLQYRDKDQKVLYEEK